MIRSACFLLGITLLICGCASSSKSPGNPQLLSFLRDGQTSREEILRVLGLPAKVMQDERILFYRLGESENDLSVRERGNTYRWADVRYSLVLVLDEAGVLKQHSLVNVR